MKIAYTVATANYLAQSKVLADSFIKHNQDYRFIICLLDKVNDRFDINFFAPHTILMVEDLAIPSFEDLYGRYNMFELSNALKPFFADYFLDKFISLELIIYLDSDMMVFNSFASVEKLLETHAICLTPHILTTIPPDDKLPNETSFLNAGVYNAGFFAISAEGEAREFIKWWKEKLRYYCFDRVCEGMFVDQLWLNLVPLLFPGVYILEDRGYNMAYYNLHERSIHSSSQTYFVNGEAPLILFHFTGYDLHQPELISRHQTRFDFFNRPDVKPLFEQYREKVIMNNHKFYSTIKPYYQELKEQLVGRKSTKTSKDQKLLGQMVKKIKYWAIKLRH